MKRLQKCEDMLGVVIGRRVKMVDMAESQLSQLLHNTITGQELGAQDWTDTHVTKVARMLEKRTAVEETLNMNVGVAYVRTGKEGGVNQRR